ncbi:hypothetical protein [Rahnella sp. PAMC 25559]|uniref:hypothetical protein n=1 Tax=Rahnella sp. PAMC 25559 TaxID=3423225 RepID=UPI003D676978
MDSKNVILVATCLLLSLPVLANLPPSSKFSFVAPELATKESSKPDFDDSPLSKTRKKGQLEWREEPKYRQYSKVKKDPMTGEITDESYGVNFYYLP